MSVTITKDSGLQPHELKRKERKAALKKMSKEEKGKKELEYAMASAKKVKGLFKYGLDTFDIDEIPDDTLFELFSDSDVFKTTTLNQGNVAVVIVQKVDGPDEYQVEEAYIKQGKNKIDILDLMLPEEDETESSLNNENI